MSEASGNNLVLKISPPSAEAIEPVLAAFMRYFPNGLDFKLFEIDELNMVLSPRPIKVDTRPLDDRLGPEVLLPVEVRSGNEKRGAGAIEPRIDADNKARQRTKVSFPGPDHLRDALSAQGQGTTPCSRAGSNMLHLLQLTLAIVWELQLIKETGDVTHESIVRIVSDVLARSTIPRDKLDMFANHLTHLISCIFDVDLPRKRDAAISLDAFACIYVEWRFKDHDVTSCASLREEELEEKILSRIHDFEFFLDERSPSIWLRNPTRKGKSTALHARVPLDALQRRHKIFLGLILNALKSRNVIAYSTIAHKTYGETVEMGFLTDDNIRRTLSNLNTRLNRVFKNVVKADRGMSRYLVTSAPFSYCWIRQEKDRSLLFNER